MSLDILIADDDGIHRRMLTATLTRENYNVHTVADGVEVMNAIETMRPDLVILDVMMPQLDGYEVCRRLRRKPEMARLPILMLTAEDSLEEKIRGLEAGADDYMTKPFQPAELLARVKVLIRRAGDQPAKAAAPNAEGKVIAPFSLRGGVGVSSIAANLAASLAQLWGQPTALVDLAPIAGHAALMFNLLPRKSWAELVAIAPGELDSEVLHNLILSHESGVSVLASPRDLTPPLTPEHVTRIIGMLAEEFNYVVLDLPHDFHEATLAALDSANDILAVATPDMGSLASNFAVNEFFAERHFGSDKVHHVLNEIFSKPTLERQQIEKALGAQFDLVLPWSEEAVRALNMGSPLVMNEPQPAIAHSLEDFAFSISKPQHRDQPPEKPTKAYEQFQRRTKSPSKGLARFFARSRD